MTTTNLISAVCTICRPLRSFFTHPFLSSQKRMHVCSQILPAAASSARISAKSRLQSVLSVLFMSIDPHPILTQGTVNTLSSSAPSAPGGANIAGGCVVVLVVLVVVVLEVVVLEVVVLVVTVSIVVVSLQASSPTTQSFGPLHACPSR